MTRISAHANRLAAVVFLLVVGATIAAFFAAQALKRAPPLLRQKGGDRYFSPNGDSVKDTARITFKLPKEDDVTVTILDDDGGTVRRVARNRTLAGKTVHTLRWDGRTDEGAFAPEGTYSVRVSLRKGGRTDTLAHLIELDVTPPAPRVEAVRGPSEGPFVLDGNLRRTATVRMAGDGSAPRFSVWSTSGRRARLVVPELPARGARRARWDGRIAGRPAPAGTYLVSGSVRDRAGNRGTAPQTLPPPDTGPAPGGVGVVVRPLALVPPTAPVRSGARARVTVEAGGRRYRWSLRRIGGGRVGSGRSRAGRLAVRIPPGPAAGYLLTVEAGRHRARTVIPAAGGRPRKVLVVLPYITWQGENDVDDTGDGLPDSLARDRAARFRRPFARGRLPAGFRAEEEPLLAFLERNRLRYDIATDLGLARGSAVPFSGHRAVVLAGDARWFQDSLGKQLRAFVEDGGRVLVLGTDSLRRKTVIRGGRLRRPSVASAVDVLGVQPGPVEREPVELQVQSDAIGLFSGTAGTLGSFDVAQPALSIEDGEQVAAAGALAEAPIFVAYRLGDGLVIRPGVRGFAGALDDEVGPVTETMRRIWTLLG